MTDTRLPDRLADALATVGENLEQQKLIGPEIQDATAYLHGLAPEKISTIEGTIAEQARLRRWRREYPRLVRLFSPRFTDSDQLERIPGLEFLFLFHRDGFLREAALNKMSGRLLSPFQFAAVVWRLNDWVEPVRKAAMRCAERCFPETAADIVARASLPLLSRQRSWGRWTIERQILDQILGRSDVSREMAVLIQTKTSGPTATSLRYALRSNRLDLHLGDLATLAIQPAVRAVASQCLIEGVATWHEGWEWQWVDKSMGLQRRRPVSRHRPLVVEADLATVIRNGVTDRSPAVRRAVLQGLIRRINEIENASEIARALLNDNSPSVRERAEFITRHAASDRTGN